MCHAGHVNQVFMNVITNAAQAIKGEGEIWIRLQRAGEDRVSVAVADSGPGVPPEIREKIFDPFFTTKDVGEGTGLGLTISESIVSRHGGFITVSGGPGEGATFTIQLPLSPPRSASDQSVAGVEGKPS